MKFRISSCKTILSHFVLLIKIDRVFILSKDINIMVNTYVNLFLEY